MSVATFHPLTLEELSNLIVGDTLESESGIGYVVEVAFSHGVLICTAPGGQRTPFGIAQAQRLQPTGAAKDRLRGQE